jgi:nitroreductase
MDVIDAIHSRRSIRSYQSNPVDRDLIESVIWDAAQAPSPFSGQLPWTFNVIVPCSLRAPLPGTAPTAAL